MYNVETSFLSRISWMFYDFLHCPESLLTMSHYLLQSIFDRFLVFFQRKRFSFFY